MNPANMNTHDDTKEMSDMQLSSSVELIIDGYTSAGPHSVVRATGHSKRLLAIILF